jgi:hypothetical protein
MTPVVCGSFRRESIAKIILDSERMKNTPIHVSAKTAFGGRPSTASRRISSFHNFLSFNHYFRKYFRLVYGKNKTKSMAMVGREQKRVKIVMMERSLNKCQLLNIWAVEYL